MNDPHLLDDRSLLSLARQGDGAAFEALYRRHRDFVAAVAGRFGAGGADGADVVQETFLYLVRKLPSLELTAELRTLLYPVAKHLALKRKGQGERFVPSDPQDPAFANVPAEETDAQRRRRVAERVADLPEGQREVVALRFADGLTLEEIAAALGLPLGTVKSRLFNALRALRASEA